MKKAVFLDRDGTINKEVGNLSDIKKLRLLPFATEAIKKIKKLGFLVIIITNQPVVARGWLTEKEVNTIHEILKKRLLKKGAVVDAIYYCPHHPNANRHDYRRVCTCRKPATGLLKKAIRQFSVNQKKSYMIGDRTADILAGKRAGLTTILVQTGFAGEDKRYDVKPDLTVKNLQRAVKIIAHNA